MSPESAIPPHQSGNAAHDACIGAPFGRIGVRAEDGFIVRIEYLPEGPLVAPSDPLVREACLQLERYLRDPAYRFRLPLRPAGTPFQHRVWAALCEIPVGGTATYGEIARRLGSQARPVGGACGANPVPPVVPCHRVVGASGLGGFMGMTDGHPMRVKRWLLAHEGVLP